MICVERRKKRNKVIVLGIWLISGLGNYENLCVVRKDYLWFFFDLWERKCMFVIWKSCFII